jgi:hypothetical protein
MSCDQPYLAERDAEGGGPHTRGSKGADVSHRELTKTMTTLGLAHTSTYTTTELVSCLVIPSACAYGSEGSAGVRIERLLFCAEGLLRAGGGQEV